MFFQAIIDRSFRPLRLKVDGKKVHTQVTNESKNLQESCKFSCKILQENAYGFHLLARFLQVFRFTCKVLASFLILLQESCKFFNSVTGQLVELKMKNIANIVLEIFLESS